MVFSLLFSRTSRFPWIIFALRDGGKTSVPDLVKAEAVKPASVGLFVLYLDSFALVLIRLCLLSQILLWSL